VSFLVLSAFRGFPWIDKVNACASKVRGVAGRERGAQDPADSCDLRVGDADRLACLFPSGDDVGILISRKDVEGLDPVACTSVTSRAV
jgi:hypothetical protein